MAFGPYGKTDWPVGCDPDWSDMNGACSDFAGNFIDQRTGGSISSIDLSKLLRGIENAVTPTAAKPTPADPAAAKPFDPVKWLGSGYNAIYAAGAFVLLIFLFKAMGDRRR